MNLFNGTHLYIKIVSNKRNVAGAHIIRYKGKEMRRIGSVLLPVELLYYIIEKNGGLFSFYFTSTNGIQYNLREGNKLLLFESYDGSLDQVTLSYVDDRNAKYLIPSYSSKQDSKAMVRDSIRESVWTINYFPMKLETPYTEYINTPMNEYVTVSVYGYLISVRKKFLKPL